MAKNIAMIAENMIDLNKSIGALLTDDIIATNNTIPDGGVAPRHLLR